MADATVDLLSPTASPSGVGKGVGRKTGVRRVNNLPLYIVGAALVLFVTAVALVAVDRANKQNAKAAAETPRLGNTRNLADQIANKNFKPLAMPEETSRPLPAETRPAEAPAEPKPAEKSVPVLRVDSLPPPKPPGGGSVQHDDAADQMNRRRSQTLEAALKARTGVQVPEPKSRMTAPITARPTPPDAVAAYKDRLAQMRSMGLGGTGPLGEGDR